MLRSRVAARAAIGKALKHSGFGVLLIEELAAMTFLNAAGKSPDLDLVIMKFMHPIDNL
jgi:hypothetical protein